MTRMVKRNVGLHFSGAKSLSLSPAAPFEEIYKADRGAQLKTLEIEIKYRV